MMTLMMSCLPYIGLWHWNWDEQNRGLKSKHLVSVKYEKCCGGLIINAHGHRLYSVIGFDTEVKPLITHNAA